MYFNNRFYQQLRCCNGSGIEDRRHNNDHGVGDSLSAGYGLPQEAGWVNLLKKRVQTVSQVVMINNSISGETTIGGRNRIEQALKTHRPDIVIVSLVPMTVYAAHPLTPFVTISKPS